MKRIQRSKRLNGRGTKNKNFNQYQLTEETQVCIQEVNQDHEDSYLPNSQQIPTEFDYIHDQPKSARQRIEEFNKYWEASQKHELVDLYHQDKLEVDLYELNNV